METTPEAPTPASTGASEATTNPTPTPEPQSAPSVDLGLTPEQSQAFKKFIDTNGGFDTAFKKLKTDVSTPARRDAPTTQPTPVQNDSVPSRPQRMEGSITANEFLMAQYFNTLASSDTYAPIANDIRSGEVLKEMASFNINPLNQDGSINDSMVRRFLDLKAKTVPAQQSSMTPDASPAPTVEYVPVEGGKITDRKTAYDVIQQDMMLKRSGQSGHPMAAEAENFLKNQLNQK